MKVKNIKKIKQGLTLMDHHNGAPLINWNFVKAKLLQTLKAR